MDRDNKNKLKLLRLLELLRQETDEQHPMATERICQRLAENGIGCERRTVALDIKALNDAGYEVMCVRAGHSKAYYVEDRHFSLPELKILIDAVQAANFISEKKTAELMAKLANLSGGHNAEVLTGSAVQFNSHKHSNEYVYYSVDALGRAIRAGQRASFLYFDLDEKHRKVYRRDGERYRVEPVPLVLSGDNYYLICYSERHDDLRHFRVDRMEAVQVEDEPVSYAALKQLERIPEYTAQLFAMYSGEPETVTLSFSPDVLSPVYDRFGEGTEIEACGNRFSAAVTVQISPTFWGWVLQFGNRMHISAPEPLAKKHSSIIKAMQDN